MSYYNNEPQDVNFGVPPLPPDVERLTSSEVSRLIIQYEKGRKDLIEELEVLSVGLNDLVARRDDLEKRVRELQEMLRSVRENLLREKSNLHGHYQKQGVYDERLRSLNRYLELAMRRETANRRLKDLSRQFDMVTHDLKWRERAMIHQINGAKHLAATEKAILADEMGLGKTLTVLATVDMVQAKKIIVISEKAVLSNFAREIKKWADHRKVVNFVEKKPGVRRILIEGLQENERGWVILVNFQAWRRDKELIDDLISLGADAILIDEAHALKDASSLTFKGVRNIAHTPNICERCGKTRVENPNLFNKESYGDGVKKWVCNYCMAVYSMHYPGIRTVKYIYPMTGTVILNKPQEMWALLHLIDPENFPDLTNFTYNYCVQAYWYDSISGKQKTYWKWQNGGLDRLFQRIPHHVLKRTKKQLVEEGIMAALPPQETQYHELEWAEEYQDQYQAYLGIKNFYQVLMTGDDDMGDVSALHIQNALMRLRQAVVWPGAIVLEQKDSEGNVIARFQCKVDHSQKLDYAENLIRELVNEGQRIVLFSKFTPPLRELQRRFNERPIIEGDDTGVNSVIMDGSTPEYRRREIAEDFDRSLERDDIPRKWNVLLANYGVGGVSLTLTGATQMIVLDREWNPGKEDQAFGRIDRIGQTEETTVHIIQMKRTVDVFMDNLIEIKSTVVDGLEETITDEEIRQGLIKLLTEG